LAAAAFRGLEVLSLDSTPPKVAAEVALDSFVGGLLFGKVIQDHDAIFEIIFGGGLEPKGD